MVVLKSRNEIERMARSGRIIADVLEEFATVIAPGMTTAELDRIARKRIGDAGARPSFLHYGTPPFPAAVCVSIDSEVVHGIPSDNRVIRDGSIVSVDIGACLDGWHSDAARTYIVGNVSEKTRQLVADTETCFWKAFEAAVPGNRIGDVSSAVQRYAEGKGYGVVRVLTGHGIGQQLHEAPDVPNFGHPGRGVRLVEGMVIAVEPMINLGTGEVRMNDDEWTIETADGEPSAHYENTIAITREGPRILTIRNP